MSLPAASSFTISLWMSYNFWMCSTSFFTFPKSFCRLCTLARCQGFISRNSTCRLQEEVPSPSRRSRGHPGLYSGEMDEDVCNGCLSSMTAMALESLDEDREDPVWAEVNTII
uniref:Uncharacterized protein n=1 Tax=Cacopsylla melanoneura TaxID=428564 RepID=A0A8D8WB19_9HEMI